ncbi:hypothetical protein K2X14_15645 [Acetobacter sp. TBRC 12305]|uniref:Uncharacterized protein n=1 Tax=Acetobacter garciniae TaxID=2817435 RepID=A0A939HQH7_9PROT|nr:hypothetical protein [Acetobacter garciniae]MBO1326549.1 hypothetical protein [Acetobacter garciniae]MBX0346269.1 hypothetical protein [Acetobacter garciniae]
MTTSQPVGSAWSDGPARLAEALYKLADDDQAAQADTSGAALSPADRIELSPQALEALSQSDEAENPLLGSALEALQAGSGAAYDPAMVSAGNTSGNVIGNTSNSTTVTDVLKALERWMRPVVNPDAVMGGGDIGWTPMARPANTPAPATAEQSGADANTASVMKEGAGQVGEQSAASLPPDPTETTPAFDVSSSADLLAAGDGAMLLPTPGQPVSIEQALRAAVQLAEAEAFQAAQSGAETQPSPLTQQAARSALLSRAEAGPAHMSAIQAWASAYDMPVDDLVPAMAQIEQDAMQAATGPDQSQNAGANVSELGPGALLSLSLQMLESVLENPDDGLFQAFRLGGQAHGTPAQGGLASHETRQAGRGQSPAETRAVLSALLGAQAGTGRAAFSGHTHPALRDGLAFLDTDEGLDTLPATHAGANTSPANTATAATLTGFDPTHLLPDTSLNAEMLGGSALVSVFAMGWTLLISGYQPRGYLPVPWARRGPGDRRRRDRQDQPDAPVNAASPSARAH